MKTPTPWNEAKMSPSKLGALCDPNCCYLCFWKALRLKFKKPFNFPMPEIMFHLDSQQKRLAELFLAKKAQLPAYFGPFCDAVEILPIATVSGFNEETGIALHGRPDLITVDADGLVSVIDNKTAQLKEPDHPLTAKYLAQINVYGYLMEKCEQAYKVSRVGVLHYSIAKPSDSELFKNVDDESLWARFTPKMTEFEYNPEDIVLPLLRKVRELIDSTEAPAGRDGCKDCEILKAFDDCMSVTDAGAVRLMDRHQQQRHHYDQQFRAVRVLDPARQLQLDSLPLISRFNNPEGVLADWDC